MKECDLLVVGGGPAGLSASESASKSGLNVICVEKKEKIGTPVNCAEGIGACYLSKLPFTFPRKFLELDIEGLAFIVGENEVIQKGEYFAGHSISRNIVEPWLASRAINNSTKIYKNTELLKIKTGDNYYISHVKKNNEILKIKSRYIIGADGVISKVAKSIAMKEKPRYSPGYVYSWEIEGIELEHPEYEYLFLGEFSPNGYGYIFPKSKNRANIGVGDLFGKGYIKQKFKKFLNEEKVKKYLKGARFVVEKSKEAPFETRHPLGDKNIFFVGDSANQNIKPFIEGFLPAIICGHALGKNIEELDITSYKELIDQTLPEISESEQLIDPMISLFKRKDENRFNEFLELMLS